jgi:hypothetical protein
VELLSDFLLWDSRGCLLWKFDPCFCCRVSGSLCGNLRQVAAVEMSRIWVVEFGADFCCENIPGTCVEFCLDFSCRLCSELSNSTDIKGHTTAHPLALAGL